MTNHARGMDPPVGRVLFSIQNTPDVLVLTLRSAPGPQTLDELATKSVTLFHFKKLSVSGILTSRYIEANTIITTALIRCTMYATRFQPMYTASQHVQHASGVVSWVVGSLSSKLSLSFGLPMSFLLVLLLLELPIME